jgi:hypothetical protein
VDEGELPDLLGRGLPGGTGAEEIGARFPNGAQEECHRRAGDDLRAAFGEAVRGNPDEPAFFVALGRIGVRVDVRAVGDDDAAIDVLSWIGQGLDVTPELGLWLARRNTELSFGALCVDGEDAIVLQHSLFADGASGVVLPRLVALIAETADLLDDELRSDAGLR